MIAVDDAPKAFVSYSHDSPEHKEWVRCLAGRLRAMGVDVDLDQWATSPGRDLAAFMQQGITVADRVLVICTKEYGRKAAAGEGGVGLT